ncbi:MAG: YjbQ family protein [Deltaproteobacteria bacterium]|nr:YjbQ family protein [Deltaproteobacteria bacterium]
MLETLSVRTNTRTELLDLTSQVQEVVNKSGVSEGLCHVFVPHTTAAVTINENADPSVKADILMVLNKIISDREPYRHQEGNSPAHVKASVIGPHLTILVSKGRLVLGTWQGVFFCEFDGPRSRRMHVKVVPG